MAVKLSLLPHVNYGTVFLSRYDKTSEKRFEKALRQFFSKKLTV